MRHRWPEKVSHCFALFRSVGRPVRPRPRRSRTISEPENRAAENILITYFGDIASDSNDTLWQVSTL